MLGALIALWIISFFVAFLIAQHTDREKGTDSNLQTFINLVLCSLPVVNLIFALAWKSTLKD